MPDLNARIAVMEAELRTLKTKQTMQEKKKKRLIFPPTSAFYKTHRIDWEYCSIERLSLVIRTEFFFHRPLHMLDDEGYERYSEIFERLITVMSEIKNATCVASTDGITAAD